MTKSLKKVLKKVLKKLTQLKKVNLLKKVLKKLKSLKKVKLNRNFTQNSTQNIARIAKRCPSDILSVVNVLREDIRKKRVFLMGNVQRGGGFNRNPKVEVVLFSLF